MCVAIAGASAGVANADSFTYANDSLRTGWYPDQPQLSPATLVSPVTNFGQIFDTPVSGKVYAQPLVADGTLVIVTEDNWVYGLDPLTGQNRWPTGQAGSGSRQLAAPWAGPASCSDLVPTVGVTGTPVIDPATGTVFFFSKSFANGTSGPAQWQAHGIDLQTGAERPGFPLTIAGAADNQPGTTFDPATEFQRPGLLLLDGVVYAAFGGRCDDGVYQGWIIGVPTTGGAPTARWVSQASSAAETGGGIWQSGGGIVSDGPGQLLFSVGNGPAVSAPTPGASPPADLGDSVVRLQVQPSGVLKATDFFTPANAQYLQATDQDLGSGAAVALPADPFGSSPNLLLAPGKQGTLYVLNRNALGGFEQGSAGGDAALAEVHVGPTWSRPAVWPGDGGHVYLPSAQEGGPCNAGSLRFLGLAANGLTPGLTQDASVGGFGFGSGAPVVTSDSTTAGSAVLWTTWAPLAPGTDPWQLRAYAAVPGASPTPLWSAPIGEGSKFAPPGVWNGHLYVGTSDGHVRAFAAGGSPASAGGTHPIGCATDGHAPIAASSPSPPAGASPSPTPASAAAPRAVAGEKSQPLLPTVFAATAQPSSAPRPFPSHPHINPARGSAHTAFALHLIADENLGPRGAARIRYRVVLTGPSHVGCAWHVTTVLSRAATGQPLRVTLTPAVRAGWCKGSFRGQVLLERLGRCPPTGRPGACSLAPTRSVPVGRFGFRVS